ncbi:hypothetical protein H6F75_17510 [Nodosilinea sp. FACHB-131]|uniref:hypothetical protein n=1 Tax=Cyanophyceae TaxID=3028117 RepID=UPI001684C8BF|nr:hypothetical protein [Nodosilinea sp. FACHB-131]MBD1875282.1 hypothetical protein [Nodosilinea sp. FACHB-131]
MALNDTPGPKGQRSISKRQLAWHITLRSTVIGLMSGAILGALFGFFPLPLLLILTGIVGAGLGLGLGLINGLLLSAIACLFLYPLRSVWLYHLIAKVMGALIAGGGAAVFGPWYFSSQGMTPSSAVTIGFGSVIASIIAGWAGGLAGQNLAQWYEQKSVAAQHESITRQTSSGANSLQKLKRYLGNILLSQKAGWISVAIFSLFSFFLRNRVLRFLVCGDLVTDVYACLPSPRLYTSVIEGLKVALPITFLIALMVVLLQRLYIRHS